MEIFELIRRMSSVLSIIELRGIFVSSGFGAVNRCVIERWYGCPRSHVNAEIYLIAASRRREIRAFRDVIRTHQIIVLTNLAQTRYRRAREKNGTHAKRENKKTNARNYHGCGKTDARRETGKLKKAAMHRLRIHSKSAFLPPPEGPCIVVHLFTLLT